MTTWIPALLFAVTGGIGLRIWYRHWRRARIAAKRRVELPNSAYASPGVRNQLDRERWGGINTRGLHPLNQEEVERLLRVVDVDGIKALSPKDRLFLDNMTLPRMG
jgi:hypothetical protein